VQQGKFGTYRTYLSFTIAGESSKSLEVVQF
jgi:hypothetical protein